MAFSRLTSLFDRTKLEKRIIPKETLIDNGAFFKVEEVRRINQLPIPCLGRELTDPLCLFRKLTRRNACSGHQFMDPISPLRKKLIIYFIGFTAALAGLLFGLDVGVISGALPFLKNDFKLSIGAEGAVVSALLWGGGDRNANQRVTLEPIGSP